MKQRPILFNTEMVQAILAGRKMQTRREVHPDIAVSISNNPDRILYRCPFGQTGDVLWVRETFAKCIGRDEITPSEMENAYELSPDRFIVYKADSKEETHPDHPEWGNKRWKPSIHMPKDAARIWLRITDVRVERLHDISEADAIAEGVERIADYGTTGYKLYTEPDAAYSDIDAKWSFESLWHSINGADNWNANPWVWVLEFERIEKPN